MVLFEVDFFIYLVGSPDVLYAFFSTIASKLENDDWGSRFPRIMGELSYDSMSYKHAEEALLELSEIKAEFEKLTPDDVVWDFEDREKEKPKEDYEKLGIKNLVDYFMTCDDRYIMNRLESALKDSIELQHDIRIENV